MPAQHLLILLVKLAVAASLASILTRSSRFPANADARGAHAHPARQDGPGLRGDLRRRASPCASATHGAYQAVDLGMEGSLVMGMLGGYVTGLLAGVFIAIPALFESKPLTMLLFAAAGVMGGLLRDLAPDKEFIWKFTPDPDSGLRPPAAPRRPAPGRFQHRLRRRDRAGRSASVDPGVRLSRTMASSLCRNPGTTDPGCWWRSTPPLCSPWRCPSRSGTATSTRRDWNSSSCVSTKPAWRRSAARSIRIFCSTR